MARLEFYDYHNMVAILEKSEHNVYFHPIVNFVEASPLRYALTFKPTVYVSHIRQFWSTAMIETTKKGTKILAIVDGILRTVSESSIRGNLKLKDEGEGSGTPIEPYYTPSPEAQQISPTTHSSPTLPPVITASIPTITPSDTPHLRQYTRRARIAQSSALPPIADEPASPLRDGSLQLQIHELMDLCTSLQRQQSDLVTKFEAQELEITMLKARVKLLEDREGGVAKRSGDDAPIKGRRLDEGEQAAEKGSNDTEEMINVLTFMDAVTVLSSGVAEIPTGSGSIPTVGPPAARVPTGSDVVPTDNLIFATSTVVTPYTRRKGKEKMIESETLKEKKIQEQMDIQMARQLEEEMERDAQRMNEQISKDAKIEYHQFATELPIKRRIELISDMIRYQDNYAKVHKYQSQQRKTLTKKQQREFYTLVLRNQVRWKVKDFKGMILEEIKENFDPMWKQIHDFIPISLKEEAKRFKRKGIRFEQESVKKLKTSEEVKATEEVPKEKVKEMIQLIPIEEVYVESFQVKHPIVDWKVHTEGQRSFWKIIRLGGSSASYQFFVDILKHLDREDLNQLWRLVKETLSIRPPTSDKEMELWVELKRLYEPDAEDQLWTHTQNIMHALVEWKLYDSCGVHHVTFKDKEIFMLVEKDYPLKKGLAIVMIGYKLQVENYSQMASDFVLKIYKIANRPRQEDD
uniref:Synaptobrevin, longin-like domain protein n=1 Tax=Tanacetum cinerariifolium TaxID=118510 RepID=A0A6L2NSH0_TANCI|nr:hypothetical protein [Tanacetum cinerariifolium]